MESKALKPTPGQIEIVSKVFPNQKKKVKVGFRLWTQKEMKDAECGELVKL